jgi:arginyl-tRNA synthetase
MHAASLALLEERYPELGEDELHTRAEQVAMAAIKFFVLLYDEKKDFVFDREASLRFDGESGPYIQYTYARCASVIAKS